MKSRINDEKYNRYKIQEEYNKIVLSCINMIIENASRDKKKRIIIKDTNSNAFPFILHVARASLDVSSGLKQEIYVQCKLSEFFKVKKKFKNFELKWTKGPHLCATGYASLMTMVAKWHKVEDKMIFEKIYEEFYNIEKLRKEEVHDKNT